MFFIYLKGYIGNGYGVGPNGHQQPTTTTFLSIDPLNTSTTSMTAKASSYYCLTPASSTTSLSDLNHSLSMNLHLNNSSSNESLNVSLSKKPKTSSSTTTSNKSSGQQRTRTSRTSITPKIEQLVTDGITIPTEPVKRKRGRPRKSTQVVVEPSPPVMMTTMMTTMHPTPVDPNIYIQQQQQLKLPITASNDQQNRIFTSKSSTTSNLQRQKSLIKPEQTYNGDVDATMSYMLAVQRAATSASMRNCHNQSSSYSPLPQLNWANSAEVWSVMKRKESEEYRHDWRFMSMSGQHAGGGGEVEPRMRAILLDWLVEISHAYRLHRETFHLAVEYFDRFMTLTKQKVRVDR